MYTQEYLDQIEKAIKKLQSGKRVVSIAYDGHVVQYERVQLKDLLDLWKRAKVALKVEGVKPKRRIVISTNKGII